MTTKDTDTHNPMPATEPLALRLSEGLGPTVPKRAKVCPLQECRGRPRCSQCTVLDEMYPPQRNLSGRGDAPAEDEATIPMTRLIELETAEHERDILRTNTKNLAMMLRKCAHRLACNGHEDLSADAVGLLRRLDLLGSPLRDATPANLSDKAPSNAARCEGCAELRDQLRDMTRQSNLDAMRVGKLAEDVERYSALHARLFVEKTAAQIEAENLRELLHRMLEAPTTQISPSWKDAIRQALARAAPEFECLGEPSLCANPRGCGCAPDSKTPNDGVEPHAPQR